MSRQFIGKSQSTIFALKKRDLSDNIEPFEIPAGIHHWITHTKMNLSIDQFSHDESWSKSQGWNKGRRAPWEAGSGSKSTGSVRIRLFLHLIAAGRLIPSPSWSRNQSPCPYRLSIGLCSMNHYLGMRFRRISLTGSDQRSQSMLQGRLHISVL